MPKVIYRDRSAAAMLVSAVPDETYCLKTQRHVPAKNGSYVICYRCGMMLGTADDPKLGTLLDY